jgi:tRNA-specific 2-thiouridylase
VRCEARLRYHAPLIAATYGDGRLLLDEPFLGAAPGQAAVLYSGTRVLGGGTIARPHPAPSAPTSPQGGEVTAGR